MKFLSNPIVMSVLAIIFLLLTDWNDLKLFDYVFLTVIGGMFLLIVTSHLYARFSKTKNDK